MGQMVGADVQELLSLAQRLDTQSTKFREIAVSSTAAILTAQWTGAQIDRVRSDWNRISKPAMLKLADDLHGMALDIRRQAEDQRTASSGPASQGVGGGNGIPSQHDIEVWLERAQTMLGHILTAKDIAVVSAFLKTGSELPLLEKITGPLGILLEGKEFVTRLQDGNYAASLVNLLSGGSSLASWVGTTFGWAGGVSLGPLALGFGALAGFVDITIPVSGEEQDQTIAMGSQHMFHKDPSELTSEQHAALANRYQGVLGPVMMISDTMDATAKKIFPWNWGKK